VPRRIATLVLVSGSLLLACGDDPSGGVRGNAFIAPACPTVQATSPCPRRPFEGTIVVSEADSGDIVAEAQTDRDGSFEIELAPGAYLALARDTTGAVGGAPLPFDVDAGRFTELDVPFDTGIRGPPA
jgi:hypothetical protein